MNKDDAITLLHQGRVKEWNAYRKLHTDWIPDLSGVRFPAGKLSGIDLRKADLTAADLSKVQIHHWWFGARVGGGSI